MCVNLLLLVLLFSFFYPHICSAANLGKRKKSIKIENIDEYCDSTLEIILGGEEL